MTFQRKSRKIERTPTMRKAQPGTAGLGKREVVRRLAGLGFSHRDDDAILAMGLKIVGEFLRDAQAEPCSVTGYRAGQSIVWEGERYSAFIEAAHAVRSRGAFGADFGVVVPMLDLAHQKSHRDPDYLPDDTCRALALAWALKWLRRNVREAQWLYTNAVDGDVLALCRMAEEA